MTRDALNEAVPRYWSDAELLRYMNRGIRDAWRQISMVNQNYQFSLNTALTMDANADTLTGVPSDLSVVLNLEAADMVANPIHFFGVSDYANADFQSARRQSQGGQAIDTAAPGKVYFCVVGAGAPVAAPTIYVAPRINAQITLALAYRPTIGAELAASGNVPLPGELDQALVHWTTAYALGRQRGEAQPDRTHLDLYQNEMNKLIAAIDPRDESGDETVVAMFEELW
ncbi:MAG TPA: hypothetical protein VGK73_32385 [Polyangiaceae bacterium]